MFKAVQDALRTEWMQWPPEYRDRTKEGLQQIQTIYEVCFKEGLQQIRTIYEV